jgi:hypothetical protein
LSIIALGEQPASAAARPKVAAHKIRSNTRTLLHKAADGTEIDANSMNYNIALLSG